MERVKEGGKVQAEGSDTHLGARCREFESPHSDQNVLIKKMQSQKSKGRLQGGTPTASPAQCITVESKEIPYPAKKSRRKV